MIVEYRMLVTESLGHNRAALMAALKEHNVKTAIVTYSGAGDSGDVDGVETIPQEAIKALEASKVTMRLPKGEFVDGQYVYRKEDVEQSIVDALRAFTFNWVEIRHGGWEINDGSSGEVIFDVKADTCTLNHTEYYTESSRHEHVI